MPAPRRRILPALLSFARVLLDATGIAVSRGKGLRARVVELEAKLGRVTAERDLLLARFARVEPVHRPRYKPFERFKIIWHRALHRLSLKRTAATFLVSTTTLSTWLRAARAGLTRLFLPAEPKRRRDLVGETAALLRWQNPSWGTRRIADVLVRLGLRTSRPTVQRKLRRSRPRRPLRLVKPIRKPPKGIRPRHAHHRNLRIDNPMTPDEAGEGMSGHQWSREGTRNALRRSGRVVGRGQDRAG